MKNKKLISNIVLCCILFIIYTICTYVQNTNIDDIFKGIIAQIQAIICLIIAYQFTTIGFIIISVVTALELIHYILIYVSTHNMALLTAGTIKFIILCTSYVVSRIQKQHLLLCKRQEELINIDDLTQVYNRRFFQNQLNEELLIADKHHTNVGLMLINIDNLKLINDNFGHDYGSMVITSIASLLKSIINDNYYLCRYGGDEFALIIPDIDTRKLNAHSIHFKKLIKQNYPTYIESSIQSLATLSIGLSVYPLMAIDSETLLKQADAALYHAKNTGKDTLHIYKNILGQLNDDITLKNKHLIAIFRALLTCLSTKDPYTFGHCQRVAYYASNLAKELGLSTNEINTLYYAGLLHDIGKIELSMSLLNKHGKLTEEEFEQVKMHPIYSANILEPLSDIYELVTHIRHHHERYDGLGYPDGLVGTDISLGARILAIVDAFDAMVSNNLYKEPISIDDALDEISCCSGKQFDPYIKEVFIKMIRSNEEDSSLPFLFI